MKLTFKEVMEIYDIAKTSKENIERYNLNDEVTSEEEGTYEYVFNPEKLADYEKEKYYTLKKLVEKLENEIM